MPYSSKESQINETLNVLLSFGAEIEEVKSGLKNISVLPGIIDYCRKKTADPKSDLTDLLFSYYILGQALSTKRCLTTSPAEVQFNSGDVWLEVLCYRKIFELFERVLERKIVSVIHTAVMFKYQAHVHLGNIYDHYGRFQDALCQYFLAAQLNAGDYMWEYNIGFALASTHGYYEKRVEGLIITRAKSILQKYLDKPETMQSCQEIYSRLEHIQVPPIDKDIEVSYPDSEKGAYNRWVNKHRLRLNAYNDINPYSKNAQDDSLFPQGVFSPKSDVEFGNRIFALYNGIKQEYVSARYMLYCYFENSGKRHFSDDNVILADNNDYANYSYNLEMAKSSFRSLYSILDKIAFIINEYLSIGLDYKQVAFSSIWYTDKSRVTLREEIISNKSVYSLAGLFFIRNDIYGGGNDFVQDFGASLLNPIRNAMEHRSIRIVDSGNMDDSGYILTISRASFEQAAFCLIRSVRQAIFCLTNMINHIEYDKKQKIGELGQLIVSQHTAVIDDKDKI